MKVSQIFILIKLQLIKTKLDYSTDNLNLRE